MASDLEARAIRAGRPRLFLSGERLERLRREIRTTHRDKWEALKEAVVAHSDDQPPDYKGVELNPAQPGTENDEMNWQRIYGYVLPGMSLVALLDDDPRYFEAVRRWAMKPGTYPLWGSGSFASSDLACDHQLFGLGCAYDWLYDRWSDAERRSLRDTIARHAQQLYEAAQGINRRGYWRLQWHLNHNWHGYTGLAMAGLALAGDVPSAALWLEKAVWGASNILARLPADGSHREGVPYWGYGMESLVTLLEALQPFVEDDLYDSDYLRRTHLFRLYMSAPGFAEVANFFDGPTMAFGAVRCFLSRLAAEYSNPLAQWVAERALTGRHDVHERCWDLLWYDPSVGEQPPAKLGLLHVFKNLQWVGVRTSWEEDCLTLHMRSGKAIENHGHLDVNNFLLNAGGEWLLRDYGYGRVGGGYWDWTHVHFSQSTRAHNCLLIGGRNQRVGRWDGPELVGAGSGWITDADDRDGVVWLRSEATTAYEGALFVAREIVLVRPTQGTGKWGYVVVRDRARTEKPETFDFLLQPGAEVEVDGDRFVVRGKQATLLGRVLAPQGAIVEAVPGIGDEFNVDDPLTLRISAPSAVQEAEFLVALAPVAPGEETPRIEAVEGGVVGVIIGYDRLFFSSDGKMRPSRSKGTEL